jgi:hypothetical protein
MITNFSVIWPLTKDLLKGNVPVLSMAASPSVAAFGISPINSNNVTGNEILTKVGELSNQAMNL